MSNITTTTANATTNAKNTNTISYELVVSSSCHYDSVSAEMYADAEIFTREEAEELPGELLEKWVQSCMEEVEKDLKAWFGIDGAKLTTRIDGKEEEVTRYPGWW